MSQGSRLGEALTDGGLQAAVVVDIYFAGREAFDDENFEIIIEDDSHHNWLTMQGLQPASMQASNIPQIV